MKKIIIIPLMFILLALSVMAYDTNDTIRINGQYKENGVYTNVTDVNITITLPSNVIAVDNQQMTYSQVGRWYYDYTIPNLEGMYDILIVYTNSSSYLGNESDSFDVGELAFPRLGVCPTSKTGFWGLWVLLIGLIILSLVGIVMRNAILAMIPAVFVLLMFLTTYNCSHFLGYINIAVGLILLGSSFAVKW